MTFIPDIEGRIRDLCAKAVAAEGEELNAILIELRSALREHNVLTREILMASYPKGAGQATSKGPKIV